MAESLQALKDQYVESQRVLLKTVEALTEEQLGWRATPTAHNIAFQVWHAARTADEIQVTLRRASPSVRARLGEGQEMWTAEGLAARWGLDASTLGAGESGYDMDDSVAARLALPAAPLLDYARRVFEMMEHVLNAAADGEWGDLRYKHWGVEQPLWLHVVDYLAHNWWTVGYIAALRRAHGLPRVLA